MKFFPQSFVLGQKAKKEDISWKKRIQYMFILTIHVYVRLCLEGKKSGASLVLSLPKTYNSIIQTTLEVCKPISADI